jgi:hypothetical protein
MGYRHYCLISGVLFSLVAIAHLLRLIFGISVQVEAYAVPMSLSWFAFVVPAALALWGFRVVLAGRDNS